MRRAPTRFLLALGFSGLGLSLSQATPPGARPDFARPGVSGVRHGAHYRPNHPRLARRAMGFADYVWDGSGSPYGEFGNGYPRDGGYGEDLGYDAVAFRLYPSVLDLPVVPGIRNEPPASPTVYVLNPRPVIERSPGARGQRPRPNAKIISLARSSGASGSEPDESYQPGGAHVIHITVPRGK